MKQRFFTDVEAGDTLPVLTCELRPAIVIAGALASRDFSPLHHDPHYAQRAGHRQIFLNATHQAAFFERCLNDWSGPRGRLGRIQLSMKSPAYAGETLQIEGEVLEKSLDAEHCGWLRLRLCMKIAGQLATECEARYALPVDSDDNPWHRSAGQWQP